MVSVTSKKKATQKKAAAAAAAKRGGKTAAVVASSKATEAHNGVDKVANGIRAFQISDRTCTGVLCSHPLSRDIHVSLLGGQVTSWRNEKGEELLFTSSKFGNRGPQEQHGFARNKLWTIEENTPDLLCIACMRYRDNS